MSDGTAAAGARRAGDWRRWVVTFGGSGMSPVAPGTAGSVAATVLLGVILFVLERSGRSVAALDPVLNIGPRLVALKFADRNRCYARSRDCQTSLSIRTASLLREPSHPG